MNVAYEEQEKRGFLYRNLLALGLTAGAVVFVILALSLIAAIPAAVKLLPVPPLIATALLWSRWVVLALLVIAALAVLYTVAPSRRGAKMRWVSVGAMFACLLWLLASLAFSFYVQNFGSYDRTFGPVAAIVVLLMWLYISAFVVILGAEINSELEMQTHIDSTAGPARPEGLREAYVADHTRPPPPDKKKGKKKG